ncbi:hypothetical protein BHE74_00034099 [Ensete ventricosum]|nr:hypothetical protein BHE74_00034099 [Ensete ventricosum]RZS01235.1 hypothetical protein BHM03_00031082 [Ensete ventricosum]
MDLKRWERRVGWQLVGDPYLPMQQYPSAFSAKHALLHPTTRRPLRTSNSAGQQAVTSASHPATPHPIPPPPPPTGAMVTGRLNPSTRLTS